MAKTLEEAGKYPVVDPGLYEAEVLEAQEKDSTFYFADDGTPNKNVVWKFRITEGEFEDSFVWGRTPPWFTTSPECKFRRWVEATLGVKELPLGYVLNDTPEGKYPDLVGARVRVFIKHNANGKAKVEEVLVSNNAAPVGAPPAAGPAPEAVAATAEAPALSGYDDFGEEPF